MKKIMITLIVSAMMSLIVGNAFAALSIEGNTVYDDVSKQYWVRDLSMFNYQTYQQQLSTISSLNTGGGYSGLSNWHMATGSELGGLYNNNGNPLFNNFSKFNPVFQNSFSIYWSGRYDVPALGATHYYFSIGQDIYYYGDRSRPQFWYNYLSDQSQSIGAWVTASVLPTPDPTPTPIPPAFLLMGSGLIGLAGMRKRIQPRVG